MPGVDVIYAADQGGSVDKYSLVGGNWVSNGSVVSGQYTVGLTGAVDEGEVVLYVVSNASFLSSGGGTIRTITDASGYNSAFTGSFTTIATAAVNTSIRGIAFTPSQFILPLKFTSLSGASENNLVRLNWTASGMEGAIEYTIERSADGRNFVSAGQVLSVKEDNSFTDAAPIAGTGYYRIKAIELNGKKTYSTILKIELKDRTSFEIFPSVLTTGELNVRIHDKKAGKQNLVIYNASGQVVWKSGFRHPGGTSIQTLGLQSLKPGTYLIRFGNQTKRFIVN